MKKLLIVESPAKVKTIAKFLGKDFKVLSTLGHVKDLPPKELGVRINGSIEILYTTLDKKEAVIASICKEARTADEIFLAPDPDREGEVIAWHVAQDIIKVIADPSKIHRIMFHEITKSAVEDAIAHPTSIDLHKVAAQQARRVLDRWVGYEVSPVLWRKVSKGLSAGRVQSVALRLICDREEEIRAFKSEEYWTIAGFFEAGGAIFEAALFHVNKKKPVIKTSNDAENLLKDIRKTAYEIALVKDSERTKQAPAPFMTSTLQQAAYNQLGFSVQKTMTIAQRLYEGVTLQDPSAPVALITYMRTDSVRIADSARAQARSFIKEVYGDAYVPAKSPIYGTKEKAQDAHEAVRPVDTRMSPDRIRDYVERDMFLLYELIWKRFLASQMKPALFAQRQVIIEGKPFTFKAIGSTLLFDGFLKIYKDIDEEEEKTVKIPVDIAAGLPISLQNSVPKQHFTQPPSRYTEASLVKEMEKAGIGRPSTYATILKTIQLRAYTELDQKKRFIPTELGMMVTKLLVQYLPQVMNISFTATMEEDLDKVAQGTLERDALLRAFYGPFEKDLAVFRGTSGKQSATPSGIICPQCHEGELMIRLGKQGSFLGCSRFPQCTFTSNFERDEHGTIKLIESAQPAFLAEKCPKCGKPLRMVKGKFGEFIACSGYPECKYIHQKTASFPCPQCGGKVVERSWKGKKFWGCSTYPTCTFTIKGDIEDRACPSCGSPYLLKKKEELECPQKSCGYHEQREDTE